MINTLLLYIPLLALTHRQNYRWRNEYTHYAWAGGTFFPVVLLSVFCSSGKQNLYLEYRTVVVLCQFFCSGRKQYLAHTYLMHNTVGVVQAWVGQKRLKSNILRRFGDRDPNIAFKIQMQCQYRSSICYSYTVTPPINYIPTLVKPFSFV